MTTTISNNHHQENTTQSGRKIPVILEVREFDGYVNANSMTANCRSNVHDIHHWLAEPMTKGWLTGLSVTLSMNISNLVILPSNDSDLTGNIWLHPCVAISYAYWLSELLGIQVAQWILQKKR